MLLEVNKKLVIDVSRPSPFNWNGPVEKPVKEPEFKDLSSVHDDDNSCNSSAPDTARVLIR